MIHDLEEFKVGDIVIEHWELEDWDKQGRWLGVIIQHGSSMGIHWIDGCNPKVPIMTVGAFTEIYDRAENYA